MKSFFASATKALATASSPKPTVDSEAIAAANGELLGRAEKTLQELRGCERQNFPLLNEATRLGAPPGHCCCSMARGFVKLASQQR